ncbi:hypothetical protein Enr13x_64530 [Stieleria neptunia]|uniref:Response regulatory domain-containing protein n=1 Tax=Stieleria neptunia TaxID=2527979 RepID=A0A518I0M2_9BACT|nr:hypothetical protein [Stieleria neptunia]QDV46544.1 hypothetical protein Enr13x_64530 [Stieleria neptunia]
MRFHVLTIAVSLASVAFLAAGAPGQFDEGPSEVPDPAEATAKSDELVRQLESTAARGGLYRAEAIRSLARIGAWPPVDRWLAQIDGVGDSAQLVQAADAIGTELLLRISLRSDLSDASRSAIKKMTAAANANQQSPERLRAAIDQLAGDEIDANLAANRDLMSGGNASVEAIVSAIAGGGPAGHRAKLLGVLEALGDGGAQALNQLALYGDPGVRASALDALRVLDPASATDTLISAALASDATADEVQTARRSSLFPQGFEKLDAIAVLADRLNTLRTVAMRTPNDLTPAILWSLNQDRTGVQPNRSTEIFRRYRDAYDAAQRLRRLGSLPPAVARSVLAADLAYRVMVDVGWGGPDQVKQVRQLYRDQVDPQSLLVALGEQRDRNDIPASVGIVRLLSDSVVSGGADSGLLVGRDGGFSELVDAVRDPQPRIRYEAASSLWQAVSGSERGFAFPGASYVRKTLAEMASLDSRPLVILLETRPVIALRQESILNQMGYAVERVTSAIDVERAIERGGDLRMVVSKIRIADAVPAELVDRVRRQPKGKRVPIVFYSDAETSEKSLRRTELETTSNRWVSDDTPAVYLVPLPGSPAALSDVLFEVESKRRLPPLSIGDRARFRMTGAAALQGNS